MTVEGSRASGLDARRLSADLRMTVKGEVRFDEGSRALYATDASNYRQVPIGVVIPRDAEDVVRTVAVCCRHDAPVLSRGGGTSLAGQCCNVAVVMDMSKCMNQVLDLDVPARRARVQPGTVLDDLRQAAERHHLTFGPDPSTHSHCTLGGMIGNNSCGVHSVMAGRTSDNLIDLEILTYDGARMRVGATSDRELSEIVSAGGRRGEIYGALRTLRDTYQDLSRARFPKIPRRVSGFNLQALLPENGFHVAQALAGSEGTCAIILDATVRLVPTPPFRALLVLGYPDVFSAADDVPRVMEAGPIALEGIDDRLVEGMRKKGLRARDLRLLPPGRGWLIVELGGDSRHQADARAYRLMDRLARERQAPSARLIDDPALQQLIWRIRESGLGATARVPGAPDTWEGWEDSAVAPERLGAYLRDLRQLMDRYGYGCALYGHFGQGCVHTRIDFDLETAGGIRRFRAFVEDAADLVLSHGGSLSGEHGDGQSRGELLPKMFGPDLYRAFRRFKAIWDPSGRMNPGKVVDAYRLDENLRLGIDHHPSQPQTHFAFPDDRGSLSYAALRCVGVGECRRAEGGTMCPSYMVTREEMHSTRGRARLLFEMLRGDPLSDGWRSQAVHEALDLCLACKGCKSECPVNVDMATYKAEFLSHHYRGRLRPRQAYAFGYIDVWARLAARAPRLINFFTQTPGLRAVARALAGMPRQRRIPRFARRTFKEWFRDRPRSRRSARGRVVLWPDTFNNHFHPDTAAAAVQVLEAAGFDVVVPQAPLCCGRPLYDFGFLRRARRQLQRLLRELAPEIRAGTPLVALEPSCLAVFRDEMRNLLPNDTDACRLGQQAFSLAELLHRHVPGFAPPPWVGEGAQALLHGHCHQKAIVGMDCDQRLLAGAGLQVQAPPFGCCGMAGSFGFDRNHYDVSMKVGERALLPAVRAASRDTVIVADGFSCREQIAQATGRRALHLAEVLALSLRAHRHLAEPRVACADDDRRQIAGGAPEEVGVHG